MLDPVVLAATGQSTTPVHTWLTRYRSPLLPPPPPAR